MDAARASCRLSAGHECRRGFATGGGQASRAAGLRHRNGGLGRAPYPGVRRGKGKGSVHSGYQRDASARPGQHERSLGGGAAGDRLNGGFGCRMAGAPAHAASVRSVSSPPLPTSGRGSLRQQPGPGARRVAPGRPAHRARAGADFCSRRRLDTRQSSNPGVCIAVAAGRTGLGVPVDRLPSRAASPVAPPHPRRESGHRLGPRQCRQVRR